MNMYPLYWTNSKEGIYHKDFSFFYFESIALHFIASNGIT